MPSLTAPLILKILFSMTTDTTFKTVNTRKLYFASQYTCCQIEEISENTHTHTHTRARARARSLRPHSGSGRIASGKYLCKGLFYVNIHCSKDVSGPFGAGIPTAASPSPSPLLIKIDIRHGSMSVEKRKLFTAMFQLFSVAKTFRSRTRKRIEIIPNVERSQHYLDGK